MFSTTLKRTLTLLPVALLATLPLLGQQQSTQQQTGDSLADAARKAREAQKNQAKPKKVYTDDDPGFRQPTPAPAPQQAAPGEAGQQATAEAEGKEAKEDPNGEKAWRKRFAEQRAKIAKAQGELDLLQRELQKADVQYYPDPQKALSEGLTRNDINTKTQKIDQKKQEIANLQQQMEDMVDQLRKSGGDPGWAR